MKSNVSNSIAEKLRMAEKPSSDTTSEPQVGETNIADQIPLSSMSIGDTNSGSGQPCCIIILGMAGSGKTTFVQR